MNEILKSIQIHLSMLDLAIASSDRIVQIAGLDDIDLLENEIENRERLMNGTLKIQTLIEEAVNKLSGEDVTADEVMIFKSWFNDLNLVTEKILEKDRQTVEILAQQKEDTTTEIAHLFKSKQSFKGYNHSLKK